MGKVGDDSVMRSMQIELDFSGGPDNWFDLWHTHTDWRGKGNKQWEIRKKYLTRLKDLYLELKEQLKSYPSEYQIWICIDEQDSSEDAVYLHTPNPNENDFPMQLDRHSVILNHSQLESYVQTWGFEIIQVAVTGGRLFYLYEAGVGTCIVKQNPSG